MNEINNISSLSKICQDWLASNAKKILLKRGERIYSQGELPKGLFFVEQGLVGLMITSEKTGKEHLLRFFKCHQFFGHRSLLRNEVHHGTSVALEPSEILFLEKSKFGNFLELSPEVPKMFLLGMAQELGWAEIKHVQILENDVTSRVANALIYLFDLYPNHSWTRQEIANFCGSTVSTVIRTMAELESQGLIQQEGRTIKIVDRDGLLRLDELSQ